MPVRVLIYRVGRTIMAGIKIDKSSESIHRRVNITKDATGTDFMIFIGNHKNILMIRLKADNTAKIMPDTPPKRKPAPMCAREAVMLVRKLSDGNRSFHRTEKTLPGVGRKISLLMLVAAMCHIKSQTKTDAIYPTRVMKLLTFFLLALNIEHSFL